MRVAQVQLTLGKGAVGEAGTAARAHREFEGDPMAGFDEKRELVAADRRDKRSGARERRRGPTDRRRDYADV